MRHQAAKSPPPRSPADELREALRQANADHEKRQSRDRKMDRRRKRFGWLGEVPGKVRFLLVGLLVVVGGLVADGIRREAEELSARVTAFRGQVSVTRAGQAGAGALQAGMALASGDSLLTGADGSVTLTFPDGSAIELEPNTHFEVRLVDYARGDVRDRSFMVRSGSIIARISRFFGASSEASICTPTAVAAARGTGFRVQYDGRTRQTYVAVVDGTVAFRTSAGETSSSPGQMSMAAGYRVRAAQGLPQAAQARIGSQFQGLGRYERPPGVLEKVEKAINNFLDPALQLIGLAPGSWSYGASYAARRSATMTALRKLHQFMEQVPEGQLPDAISLVTLEEVVPDPLARDQILDTLAGKQLLSYEKTGVSAYRIRARSRDKKRTLYELTPTGPAEIRS